MNSFRAGSTILTQLEYLRSHGRNWNVPKRYARGLQVTCPLASDSSNWVAASMWFQPSRLAKEW
jgi:hypothetical protein